MNVFISKRTLWIAIGMVVAVIFGPQLLDRLTPDPADALEDYEFSFQFQAPIPETLDEPFAVSTNNCNSPVDAIETFKRKRDFTVQANWQITEALLEQIGRQLGLELSAAEAAKLHADIENKLTQELASSNGIDVGYTETFETERQIITPPNSISTAWLQWEELRFLGTVAISDTNGVFLDEAPFYIVRDLRLSQVFIDIQPCGMSLNDPEQNPPTISMPLTNENAQSGTSNTGASSGGTKTSTPPRLVAPSYGVYQNPLSFSWDGSDNVLYQVHLLHGDRGFKHTSEWIQGFIWVYSLPGEQYGNWNWYVTTKDGVSSDIWNFVFDPFPGSGNSNSEGSSPQPPSEPTAPPSEPTPAPATYPGPPAYP